MLLQISPFVTLALIFPFVSASQAATSKSSLHSGIPISHPAISSSFSSTSSSLPSSSGSGIFASTPSTPTPTFSGSFGPIPTGIPKEMCSFGNLQCCAAARPENDPQTAEVLDAFSINAPGDPNALVGILCTDMAVPSGLGTRASSLCSGDTTEAVCCADNTHDGVVALECLPVSS